MRKTLNLVTGIGELPFTLADIKSHLVVEYNDRDDEIEAIMLAAVAQIEDETGRAWIEQTWDLILPAFPRCGEIVLPKPPLKELVHVKYYDQSGTLQTLATDQYYVMMPSISENGWIQAKNFVFPIAQVYRPDAVQIRFVAGNSTEIDPQYIHLVKLICGALWSNKEGQQPKDQVAIDRLMWNLSQKGYC
ncbi:MAG: phage head-tail connector protein [Planctomycetaceae bacterium]